MAVNYKQMDTEFEDYTITAVEPEKDGWMIGISSGWSFYIPAEPGVVPHIGDSTRFYGRGIGYTVRGVDINGQEVYYKTPEQAEAEHRKWVAEWNEEQRRTFEANKTRLDAEYEALPEPFKKRIDRFRSEDPDFRWQSEGYEMFCCTQAVAFAEALKTPEAVRDFAKLDWDEQKALVSALHDGHSGNTFAGSCALAIAYLEGREI